MKNSFKIHQLENEVEDFYEEALSRWDAVRRVFNRHSKAVKRDLNWFRRAQLINSKN